MATGAGEENAATFETKVFTTCLALTNFRYALTSRPGAKALSWAFPQEKPCVLTEIARPSSHCALTKCQKEIGADFILKSGHVASDTWSY